MPTDGSDKPAVPSTDPVGDRHDAPDGDAAGAGTADAAGDVTTGSEAAEAADAVGVTAGPEAADAGDGRATTPRIPLDLVGGLALLAIVAVALLNAGEARLDWLFPKVLGYALGAIGIYLTIRGLFGVGDRTDTLLPILRGRGVDVFVFAVLMAVYVILVRPVGFWIMSALTLFAGSVYLDGTRSAKRMALAALVAVVVCVLAYLLLVQVFYIPLPRARWFES